MWPDLVCYGILYRPPVCFRVDARVEVPFLYMQKVPPQKGSQSGAAETTPFGEEENRSRLRDRLEQEPSIELPESVNGRPTFGLSVLQTQEAQENLVKVFNRYIEQIVTE